MSRLSKLSLRGVVLATLLPVLGLGSSAETAHAQDTCPAPGILTRGFHAPLSHVRYLADDALEGREVGSRGARCAGDYIARAFQQLGLGGAGPDGSFFQLFSVRMGSTLGEGNRLTFQGEPREIGRGWVPFGFSRVGSLEAPLVYGGLGVSRPGSEEDAYAHMDIQGKIVVVEGRGPHGSEDTTLAGDPHFKASVAAGRGASGIVVLLPDGVALPDPREELRPEVNIVAIAVTGAMAEALRTASRTGGMLDVDVALEPRMIEARNVAALLPGQDPALEREVVVVGAHYDHLGFGGDGSLDPDSRAVHNGADDNASGTAALLEVAARLAEGDEPPARSVLFLAFTGEEKGLWGSGHYVENPLVPLERTVAMVNMDMVGRLRENTLTVYGTGTAEEWADLLDKVNRAQAEPFGLTTIPDGFGASDHAEFYDEDIPVLMLFTNTHSEYHRPEDDWELINEEGLVRVSGFATGLVRELAGTARSEAMTLTFLEGAGNPHGAMARESDEQSRPSRGSGAYMGTIPDMTPQEFGVRITGVREGSPAEKAGLQGGDVIIAMGDRDISDLYAYTYALRDHKPGDEVSVVVLREGERLTFTAILGSR